VLLPRGGSLARVHFLKKPLSGSSVRVLIFLKKASERQPGAGVHFLKKPLSGSSVRVLIF
jgi:hypothetical protein